MALNPSSNCKNTKPAISTSPPSGTLDIIIQCTQPWCLPGRLDRTAACFGARQHRDPPATRRYSSARIGLLHKSAPVRVSEIAPMPTSHRATLAGRADPFTDP
jgi:hypothetical protein